ncbi:MAG: amino acid permease [Acidobacteria bacterium]|nr:amino acid permease [Acidobacteriota bacterium]MBI3264843.1 amino acid permease [Acidobacteriota bacterium]
MHPPTDREQGLVRQLTAGQQAMMAFGTAIGTGLFLGSGLTIGVAGPAVVFSYVIAAAISLLLSAALVEMAVAHPAAGSFGLYAEMYVSPFAGYAVRVSYWLMQVIATGGHMVAISIYMQYWWPGTPSAVWMAGFSAALIYLNTRAVGTLGAFEYWFSMIKVAAIVVFVVLAAAIVAGLTGDPAIGFRHYAEHGGFWPKGIRGVWLGACFAIYSFIGVEVVGVTSGEARDPERTIPQAMRRMVGGLCGLYLTTVALLVAIMPWDRIGVGESPFVTVLTRVGIPAAASLMNFVVLTAALSSANANLYLITRTLFSLARGGFVPSSLGALTASGIPRNALLVSSVGLAAALVVRVMWPDSAYVWFFGIALFGALFVWLMIFVTHLAYRRSFARSGSRPPLAASLGRAASIAGALAIAAVLVTTWWVPGLQSTLIAGGPWLAVLGVGYLLSGQPSSA